MLSLWEQQRFVIAGSVQDAHNGHKVLLDTVENQIVAMDTAANATMLVPREQGEAKGISPICIAFISSSAMNESARSGLSLAI